MKSHFRSYQVQTAEADTWIGGDWNSGNFALTSESLRITSLWMKLLWCKWSCDNVTFSQTVGKTQIIWWFIASIALLSGWSNGTLDKVQYSPPLHAALSVQITPVEKAFNWRTRALPLTVLALRDRERTTKQRCEIKPKIFQGGKLCNVSVQAGHCGEHFASDLSRTTLE